MEYLKWPDVSIVVEAKNIFASGLLISFNKQLPEHKRHTVDKILHYEMSESSSNRTKREVLDWFLNEERSRIILLFMRGTAVKPLLQTLKENSTSNSTKFYFIVTGNIGEDDYANGGKIMYCAHEYSNGVACHN